MAIDLGKDPIVLISLSFLEILLIIIPTLIASKIEKKSILDELKEIGFQRKATTLKKVLLKIIAGVLIGIAFFFLSGYLISFFLNFLVLLLFGSQFVEEGINNAISTTPLNPSILQLIILIAIQIVIVAPCEEGFFRGFLIKKTHKKIKLLYSVLFSSIMFTLYHIPPFLVPLSTIITFFGYYFSFAVLLALTFILFKNSLLPSSIAHFTLNILILLS
ncbi:MAG: CPBP family intramembrane metalloprotease [Candidatus Lokiarchaeota archaeon]|nr:CPBP family intramembrane metalloprotease [Candidatus Lokiarchaeota archaeon]